MVVAISRHVGGVTPTTVQFRQSPASCLRELRACDEARREAIARMKRGVYVLAISIILCIEIVMNSHAELNHDIMVKRSTWWTKRSLFGDSPMIYNRHTAPNHITEALECVIGECTEQYSLCSFTATNSEELAHCCLRYKSCSSNCFLPSALPQGRLYHF
ncbi:uncharacterized protein LOC135210468 [Macrobrachium nipponense]|uniref:uncharacterized protein LOC135210468 n=1 Tax=Macrobrachium nipponense TaxID=159736 RepID=UPI0030C8CFFE